MKQRQAKGSREAAIEILCQWAPSGKPVDILFNQTIQQLSDRDRGLVKTLVYGILRQQDFLDYIIQQFSKHPLKKMKLRTLITLRVGVYQLLFLNRIPASAAVNETVKAMKTVRQPKWLISFVNGTLRNISRNTTSLPLPEEVIQEGVPLLNHPQWLVERWNNTFGRERTQAICRVNNTEPLLTLRVNSKRTTLDTLRTSLQEKGIQADRGKFSPESLTLTEHSGAIHDLPGYHQGWFHVQDQAAQLASLLLGPFAPGQRILDACAGLGGKTSHLAQLLAKECALVALEPDNRRFSLLKDNLQRLAVTTKIYYLHTNLEAYIKSSPQHFDQILLDAPCSGTGVIRRQPDIRWNRKPEDIAEYQKLQRHLLNTAAPLLKEGGRLVYATCSMEGEENEEVIEQFLAENPGFCLINAKKSLPQEAHCLVNEHGYFQPLPIDGIDGFFAACISRTAIL